MDNKQSVVITGGAGFIGSFLCQIFLEKGYQVIAVDNLLTGKKENIQPFLKQADFKFIKADVSRPSIIKKLTSVNKKIKYLLHFASPAGPNPNSAKSYLKFPIKTYLANSIGSHYLLKIAEKTKAQFLFASTSEIYGDPDQHPQTENYNGNVNPLGPRACYDESKRFGEMATVTFGKKYHLTTKIVRIFNTYGPRMNLEDGRVIPIFINQALQNKPITIYGDGSQTRSFCYIDDFVKGIFTLLNKAQPYQAYNLGNDQEIKIIDLAKLIKKLTDSSSKLVYRPLPKDDPLKRQPALKKIKALNWQPETNLTQGLKKTIDYFKRSNHG